MKMLKSTTAFLFVILMMVSAASAQDTPKIAVASTSRIFNDMQETKDLNAKMEAQKNAFMAENKQRTDSLNALKQQRDELVPTSKQYDDRNKELLKASIEYDNWGKFFQAQLQQDQKTQLKALFDKIEAATAEVAKQKGYDLVLAQDRSDFPALDKLDPNQVIALINERRVLYAGPKADITDAIITYLDQQYKAGK